ncbi:uncharacterized protein [Diabrotica undecimpunctata]|uniref:uncharacterized protein n=1 Tax=Diabrotica undecimpunctata TaxID=50387 RepID=UPI003B6412A1
MGDFNAKLGEDITPGITGGFGLGERNERGLLSVSSNKPPQVLAKKGEKRLHFVAPEHGENVPIVSCGTAVGQVIPPMIIFKGKLRKPEWEDYLTPGTAVEMTDNGSMTTSTYIKWLHHFAKYKLAREVFLIFDGVSSHLDPDICDVAEGHSIRLYCLPSNTTHKL